MNWNRRKFVKTTSVVATMSSCGLINMVGCTPIKYVTGEVRDDALVIDKSQLEEAAFLLVKNQRLSAPIFVKKTEKGHVALFLECTHKQCEVRPNSKSLKCPCHGSQFDHQGKVIEGPAETDLKSFRIWEDGNSIFIQ